MKGIILGSFQKSGANIDPKWQGSHYEDTPEMDPQFVETATWGASAAESAGIRPPKLQLVAGACGLLLLETSKPRGPTCTCRHYVEPALGYLIPELD